MRILVTGGSTGLGAAIAAAAAARGHQAFAGARRFKALRRSDHPGGGGLFEAPLDVTDFNSCRSAVAEMKTRLGGVDVVVANAGVAAAGSFEETPVEEFRRLMEVNYYGAVHIIKAALPEMRAARGGLIVVISSLSALVGLPGDSAYAASKFALEGACEALAAEVSRFGVRIILAEPGAVDTPLTALAPDAPRDAASPYRAFNAFLNARARSAGGAAPCDIAKEILDIIEKPSGDLRRPVGDQARMIVRMLATIGAAERAALARRAAGLDWWANGDDGPPRDA